MSSEKIIVKIDSELEEIVFSFIDKRKKEIPTMWESLKKMDFLTLQTLGHRLRGNAGGYGFDHLGLVGAAIEIGAQEKDTAKIELALKELEDYLSRVEVVFEV